MHLRFRSLLLIAAGAVGIAVYGLVLYRVSLHWVPNSDNASYPLLGEAVITHNPFLRGWTLANNPLWASEVPMYALAVALVGLGPSVTHLVPTAIWGVLAATSVFLAAASAPRRAAVVGGVSAGCLIGIAGPGFLEGPIHVGTTMLGTLALAATYAAATRPWKPAWSLAAILVLASAIAGDPLAIGAFAVPIAAGVVAVAVVTRAPRWLYLLVIPLFGYGLARLELQFKDLHHGYSALAFQPVPTLDLHLLLHTVASVLAMLSLWPLNPTDLLGMMLSGGRWLLVGAAIAGLLTLLRRVRFTDTGLFLAVTLLLVGAADVLGFALFAGEPGTEGRRLMPALVAFGILLARLVGHASTAYPRATAAVCSISAAAQGSVLVALASQPMPNDPHAALGSWLRDRDLLTGYAAYWDAAATMVDSGGTVHVYPVAGSGSGLGAFPVNSNTDWYSAGSRAKVQFVVVDGTEPVYGVDEKSAVAEFGPPAETERVGKFRVLIWGPRT